MLKQLPLKKNYLLIAGVILLLPIVYCLAFKQTLLAWQIHNQLTRQLAQAGDINYQPQYILRKDQNLSKVLNLYKADTTALRNNILTAIAGVAEKENVKLTEVPVQDPLYHGDQYIIQRLKLEGDYFSLLKVCHNLDATKGIGIVRAVSFKSVGLKSNQDMVKRVVMDICLEIAK